MLSPKQKHGTVEDLVNGYWQVRYGPGITEIYNLRPNDFFVSRPVVPGMKVTLSYVVTPSSGLWKAREYETGA